MISLPGGCELSGSQVEILEKFSEQVKDIDNLKCSSTSNLIRWLVSQNWNLQQTEKAFRDHIAWREKYKVDTILSSYHMSEVISKYFPGGICGKDKYGRPLFVAPIGYFDPKSFLKVVSRADFIQSRIYELEKVMHYVIPEASEVAAKQIDQLVVLMDMEGLGFKHLSPSWVPMMVESVTMIESNYPELLHSCYVINAPSLFYRLYGIVRPLLSKVTQEKIHVLSSDYRDVLLRHFDADALPKVYGGTMTDPDGDPRCTSRICWAGTVPETYVSRTSNLDRVSSESSISRSSSAQYLGHTSQFSSIEVNRGGLLNIPVGFVPEGSELVWLAFCESHDINMGLFVKPCEQTPESRSAKAFIPVPTPMDPIESDASLRQVVSLQRVTTRASPFEGKHRAHITGFYYLRLDNTYSWMRTKRVRYAVKILSPEESNGPKRTTSNSSDPQFTYSSSWHTAGSQTSSSCRSSIDIPVFTVPSENLDVQPRLVTGGSMDVDISLLFRLLAQLLLVPRLRNTVS